MAAEQHAVASTLERILALLEDEHIQLLLLQVVALIGLYVHHRRVRRKP